MSEFKQNNHVGKPLSWEGDTFCVHSNGSKYSYKVQSGAKITNATWQGEKVLVQIEGKSPVLHSGYSFTSV